MESNKIIRKKKVGKWIGSLKIFVVLLASEDTQSFFRSEEKGKKSKNQVKKNHLILIKTKREKEKEKVAVYHYYYDHY